MMAGFIPSDSLLDRVLTYNIARRVQFSWVVYIIMVGFFSFGTEEGRNHRLDSCLFLALFVATGVWRYRACAARLEYGERGSTPRPVLVRLYTAYLVNTMAWNLYTIYIFYTCFGNVTVEAIMVICVGGVTSSGTSILSPSRNLSLILLHSQLSIAIIWSLFAQAHFGLLIAVVAMVYAAWQTAIIFVQSEHTVKMFAAQLELEENGEALRAAKDVAERVSGARARFLANMSHEIRTPLNGLLGLTQILQDDETSPEDRREMLATMVRSGNHLRSIVDDILDYSKLSAGRMDLEHVPVHLPKLLSESVESVAPLARDKGLHIELQTSPCVQEWVKGDPVRIRQIALNLLSNAIKFTQYGEVLAILERGEKHSVRLTVRDTGIGIAPENRKYLFQDFAQLDASTKRRFGGTGLGLAISKQLVEQMGGEIRVESEPGQGTTFHIEIPFEAASETSLSEGPPPVLHAETSSKGDWRILIAEDNPVNRRITEVMVRRLTPNISVAFDGVEAVRMHTEHPFDLILMDGNMPLMDGFEATAEIRKMDGPAGRVPIIALTANALREDRQRCLDAGMTDYLAKPVRREELEGMVRHYCAAIKPGTFPAADEGDATHAQPAYAPGPAR